MNKRGLAVSRETEGHRPDEGEMRHWKSTQTVKSRGRPAGSKNKSKSIVPAEVANEILDKLKPVLPEEHYDYMRGVISRGKKIDIERELDVIILLLNRQLIPALIAESEGKAEDADPEISSGSIKMPAFSKAVSERLKVVQSFMDMKLRMERHKDESKQEKQQPILTIFAQRGIDIQRLGVIASSVPGDMGGGADDIVGPADRARTVSDTIPERQLVESSGSESSTDWILDGVVNRDDSRSLHEV